MCLPLIDHLFSFCQAFYCFLSFRLFGLAFVCVSGCVSVHFSVLSRRPGYIIDVASLIIIIDTVSGAHCVYVVQICALLLSTVRVCEQPDKLMTGLLCPKVPLPAF